MRPGELLRQLDRKLLPRLANRVADLDQKSERARVLAWTTLLCSFAVLVTAVWTADHRPVEDMTVGEVVRVGVVEGQSIPGYVAASRGELAAMLTAPPTGAEPETYALVAFTDYVEPEQLPPVLDGVAVVEVFARVPLPQTQTEIVRMPASRLPGDVLAGMLDVADRKEREARDYQRRATMLPAAADQTLRDWYDSSARVASAEAAAYRSGCGCVYAAVVRATPTALEAVIRHPRVRTVDPAPEVRRLERTVFTPPLPEQHDVVRPPEDDAMPTPPTGIGPADGVGGVPSDAPTSTAFPSAPGPVEPSGTVSPAPSVTTVKPLSPSVTPATLAPSAGSEVDILTPAPVGIPSPVG